VFDGKSDCEFNEDEFDCGISNMTTCVGVMFLCSRSNQCIDERFRCNEARECLHGEGEFECPKNQTRGSFILLYKLLISIRGDITMPSCGKCLH